MKKEEILHLHMLMFHIKGYFKDIPMMKSSRNGTIPLNSIPPNS